MEKEIEFTIHEKREINKMSLETFTMDFDVLFDYSIDQLIKGLQFENKNSWEELEIFKKREKKNPHNYQEQLELGQTSDIHIDLQKYEYIEGVIFNNEQLQVLSEMKIIYAYKIFEINIKKLLRATYAANTQSFYRWSLLINFLQEKNIKVSALNGYKEIIELQNVNNSLKHSEELSEKVMEIKEFKGSEIVTFIELNKFYARVKEIPKLFLSALATEIYKDLYEFNDQKLTKIANSILLRMDKESAFKLTEKIRSSY